MGGEGVAVEADGVEVAAEVAAHDYSEPAEERGRDRGDRHAGYCGRWVVVGVCVDRFLQVRLVVGGRGEVGKAGPSLRSG